MTTEHTISEDDDDIRLDRWFKRHYPGFPHAMLEKQLRKGQVRLDGKKAKTSDRVKAGQVLRCPDIQVNDLKKQKPKKNAKPEDLEEIRKWVIYRDQNIIVINKPAGLAVQGGSKITKSVDGLLDGLIFDAKERPKLTHRLDRDTSGVLVLARNSKVAAQLAKAFAGKDMEKTYWALVMGAPMPGRGVIDLPLAKAEKMAGFEQVSVDEEMGKRAISEYRVVESLVRKCSFVELKPLTGRMHQLRVHMVAIGCPIVGDSKYGHPDDALQLGIEDQLHLHARRIVIPAIGGQKPVEVSAPLPGHMQRSFKTLGITIPKK